MAHVGDRHDEAIAVERALATAVLRGLAIHSVVEVTGVFAVDGDERHVGEVDAITLVGGAHLLGQAGRLRQSLRRETMRHFVLAHRDLDLHAGVVDLAQHFGHAAHRLRIQRRGLGQLDGDDLACGRVRDRVLRDHDVLTVALVFGRHEPDAALVQQAADDGRLAALEDLEHAALGAALAVVAHHARLHTIAMQHRTHFLRRKIEIGLVVIAHDEAVSIAMALHCPFDFAHQLSADGSRV